MHSPVVPAARASSTGAAPRQALRRGGPCLPFVPAPLGLTDHLNPDGTPGRDRAAGNDRSCIDVVDEPPLQASEEPCALRCRNERGARRIGAFVEVRALNVYVV